MPVTKSAEAFRTISEAATELDVPQHVLRHWEEVFGQIRPMRRAGGRRYYRPVDLDLLRGVRVLLHEQGYTTKGVQKIFKENGVKYIAEIGRLSAAGEAIDVRPVIDEEPSQKSEDTTADHQSPHSDHGPAPSQQQPSVGADALEIRTRLTALLSRLEKVEAALDEATLALDTFDDDYDVGDDGTSDDETDNAPE